jgi:hypothetical protein
LETAGLGKAGGFLTTEWVLGCLGGKKGAARRRYRQFVAEGTGLAAPWRHLVGQVLLGEETFVQRCKALLVERETIQEIPRQQRYAGRLSLIEIFDPERLATTADRNRAMHQAHMHQGYTLKQIADHLRLHYTTVSKAVRAVEARQ